MTTMSAANYDPMQQQYHQQQRHQQQQQQQQHHQQHQQLGHNNGDPKEPNIFIPDIIEERKKVPEGYAVVHKFACGKLLGKGGFARCYIGTSLTTNGKYALKIVPKCNIVKPRAKQKLQSEIKIHRALSHENIVKFDRCFEDAHNAYILLELCSNNSMSEMMKKRRKLIEPEVRYYIAHLVNSLQYLHRNLVIHRDLKLGNLFIDGLMRLKVGDFGLAAKLIDPDEKRKTVCGTPNYIAPEILSNKDGHSFEVDIWSTGVVMYTLLVGKPPFETKDVKSTYKKITECSYVFPDGCGVSENAISLIRSMLQLRPERRPSLEEILDHPFFTHPSSYLPPSLPETSLREAPVFNVTSSNNNDLARKPMVSSSSGSNHNLNSNAISKSSHRFGDENDPGAVNRMSSGSHSSSNNHNNNLDSNNNYNIVKPSVIAAIDAVTSQSQQGSGVNSKPFYSRQSSADVAKSNGVSSNSTTTSSNSNSNSHSRPLSASSGSSGTKVSSKSEARPKISSPNSIPPPSSSSSSSTHHHSNNIVESIGSSKTSSSTTVGSNLSNPNRLSSGSSGSNGNVGLAHQNHQGKSQSSTSGAIQSNSSSGVTSTASSVSTKLGFEIYSDITTASSTIANTTTASTVSKQSVSSSSAAGSSKTSDMQPTKQAYYSNGVNMSSSGSVVSATSTVKSGMSYGSNGSSTAAHTAVEGKVSSGSGSGSNSNVVTKPSLAQSAVDAVNDGYLNRHLIQSKQSQSKQQQQQQQQINSAVDDIQQDIENIRVDDKPNEDIDYSRKSGGDDFLNRFGVNSSSSNNNNKPKGPVDLTKKPQAWAWDDDNTDNNSKGVVGVGVGAGGGANSSSSNKGGIGDNKVVAGRQSQIPTVMQTPAANIIPPNNGNEQINTLEAMHKMLDNSYINTHSPTGNKNYLVKNFSSKANGEGNISITEENLVSKVWVVRYVDYTSKYGLGFLLNTGSSGVYFNDSTKIILSADGSVFQYIERRKKDSTSSSSSSSSEHVIQAHLMTAYPMELQKKVLLLRHFRNYLIEQQKASAERQDELDNYSEPIHSLPMLADTGVSGANPNIAFGFSSVVARGFDEDMEEMTYVKKWVRTRHAILFRLSNKTVQIVFFDRSEIVLSSEARVVTYVNKQGLRSEFSLEEVMQDGRADIAKRLRYTKDIMYRLINSQPNR